MLHQQLRLNAMVPRDAYTRAAARNQQLAQQALEAKRARFQQEQQLLHAHVDIGGNGNAPSGAGLPPHMLNDDRDHGNGLSAGHNISGFDSSSRSASGSGSQSFSHPDRNR